MPAIPPTGPGPRDTPTRPRGPRPLPAQLHDLLRDGAGPDRAAQQKAIWWIACEAVRNGWNAADFAAAFSDARNPLRSWFELTDDGKLRKSPVGKMHSVFASAKADAEKRPAIQNQAGARQEVGLLRAELADYPWSGRNHLRDRAVLEAITEAAARLSTMTPAISTRTIAEATPFKSRRTVSNAIASLIDLRLLAVVKSGEGSDQPTIYRLRFPPKGVHGLPTPTVLPYPGDTAGQMVHSALATAMGAHAAAVYGALAGGEILSATEIAQRAGVSRRTAFNKLRYLAKDGLVESAGSGWARTSVDAHEVTRDEAEKIAAKRVKRHARERKGWREHVATRGPRRKRAQFSDPEWEGALERGPSPGQGVDPEALKPVSRKQYEAAVKAARARRDASGSD